MVKFNCKKCGTEITVDENLKMCTCGGCQSAQSVPQNKNEHIMSLHSRANKYRIDYDFDRAEGVYEMILEEVKEDPDLYWALFLCRYGIEYVEDRRKKTYTPTMNRVQFVSVRDDEYVKKAFELASPEQKSFFENEIITLEEIQKNILSVSDKEEPFEVFICYKENDESGRRTEDSRIANEIYQQLTKEGIKTFFARVTLEDKLGTEYEPYIFAALNSAKIMIVMGTQLDFYNAVWVRNEWARFISIMEENEGRTLIPMFRNIDPYDLPKEFQGLQALDMGKFGFMQDLLRNIKYLLKGPSQNDNKDRFYINSKFEQYKMTFIQKAEIFVEKGEWSKADECCEKILGVDAKCAEAYLGKVFVKWRVKGLAELEKRLEEFLEQGGDVLPFIRRMLYEDMAEYIVYNYYDSIDIEECLNIKEFANESGLAFYLNAMELNKEMNVVPFRVALEFATGDTKMSIERMYDRIQAKINQGLNNESGKEFFTAYKERIELNKEKIKTESQAAREERERDYNFCAKCIGTEIDKITPSQVKTAIAKLKKIGIYKDAKTMLRDLEDIEVIKMKNVSKVDSDKIDGYLDREYFESSTTTDRQEIDKILGGLL